jgi:hypothetical protein
MKINFLDRLLRKIPKTNESVIVVNIQESSEHVLNEILNIDQLLINIENMTKLELDEYAKNYDIHLDRRRNKSAMIEEFIQKLKEKK